MNPDVRQNLRRHLNLKMCTEEQTECVEFDANKNLAVDAVAGSGKTTMMICRILKILACPTVEPSDIIVLTYTNNATNEIRKRMRFFLENFEYLHTFKGPETIRITTFHKYCEEILKTPNENILTEEKYQKIIKKIKKEEIIGSLTHNEIDQVISNCRYEIEVKYTRKETLNKLHVNIYESYLRKVQSGGFVHNTDYLGVLIRFILFLKSKDDEELKKIIHQDHIFIDEVQDMNVIMFELLRIFFAEGTSINIAGDSRQKIYSYCGLSMPTRSIIDFVVRNELGEEKQLTINHRCHENIHKASMRLFELDGVSVDYNTFDFRVNSIRTPDWTSQSNAAANFSRRIIARNNTIAILFRTNKEKKLFHKNFVKETDLENRISLNTIENEKHNAMLTVHSSKGLEFDFVVVFSVIEMNIPKYRPRDGLFQVGRPIEEKLEEEKRLLYVALTRAKKLVILISPKSIADSSAFSGWQIKRGQKSEMIQEMEPYVDNLYDPELMFDKIETLC